MVFSFDLELLLIKRATVEGDPWSGHLALPGGRQEDGETLLETALRETCEEIGFTLSPANLLGELDENASPAGIPRLVVRPFVFCVDRWPAFHPAPGEVDGIRHIGLEALLEGHGRSSFAYPYLGTSWTLPCVDVDGDRLWGMTLRMVDDLLHRLDGRGTGLDRVP